MDCETCDALEAQQRALEELPEPIDWVPEPVQPEVTDFEIPVSTEAEALELAARYRAALAGQLGIPLEAVEVAVAGPRIVGASVFLDISALLRLAKDLT